MLLLQPFLRCGFQKKGHFLHSLSFFLASIIELRSLWKVKLPESKRVVLVFSVHIEETARIWTTSANLRWSLVAPKMRPVLLWSAWQGSLLRLTVAGLRSLKLTFIKSLWFEFSAQTNLVRFQGSDVLVKSYVACQEQIDRHFVPLCWICKKIITTRGKNPQKILSYIF